MGLTDLRKPARLTEQSSAARQDRTEVAAGIVMLAAAFLCFHGLTWWTAATWYVVGIAAAEAGRRATQ